MPDQLELFDNGPFTLRIRIDEALKIFFDNYWRHRRSAKTTAAPLRRLRIFFKDHYLDTISKTDVERLRRWMETMGYAAPTINKTHMLLSRVFTWFNEAKEGKYINLADFSKIVLPTKNPAALVPKVNERKFARTVFITKEQKKVFCSYADEDLCEIIDGLYWTMLRPSDFFTITSDNVDLGKKIITGTQRKTITTRNPGGVPYKVSIPDEKLAMIKRRVESTKPGTPLFRRRNMQKRWNKVRAMAGMPEAQMRDLRGGAASHLMDNGVDVETVRKTLGHTTLRMLPVYDKRPDDRMKEATKILV